MKRRGNKQYIEEGYYPLNSSLEKLSLRDERQRDIAERESNGSTEYQAKLFGSKLFGSNMAEQSKIRGQDDQQPLPIVGGLW